MLLAYNANALAHCEKILFYRELRRVANEAIAKYIEDRLKA